MKKLIAAMLLGMMCVAPVRSQNLQNRFDAYGNNQPDFTAQSYGTNYFQLFSRDSDDRWSLGYGTTQSSNGTALVTLDASLSSVIIGSTVDYSLNGTLIVYSTGTKTTDIVLNVADHLGVSALQVDDNGGTILKIRTLAQLQALAPARLGESFLCSNCAVVYSIVTGTGTSAGNFVTQGQTIFK